MLAAASVNFQNDFINGKINKNQVVYGIRFISYFTTFYRAEFTSAYLQELNGQKRLKEQAVILRYPKENGFKTGLTLIEPKSRKEILNGLVKLRDVVLKLL